jgi:hypothetical protein
MNKTLSLRRIVAPPIVVAGIVLNALAALVVGGLHLLLEAPPLRAVAWPGTVALAAAYVLPAALATIALRSRRPAALLTAGLASLPLALTAMSGISLILLVPAACYLTGYAAWTPRPPLRTGAVAGIVAILAAGIAAPILLSANPVGRPTAYCYSWTEDVNGHRSYSPARRDPGQRDQAGSLSLEPGGPGGQGCTSDIVTLAEAASVLGATAVALAVSLRLPRTSPAEP